MDSIAFVKHYLKQIGVDPEGAIIDSYDVWFQDSSTDDTVIIDGENEFYFLATRNLKTGTIITCPLNHFEVMSDSHLTMVENITQKVFSGKIKITVPKDPQQHWIWFIRAIPKKLI